jgi:hypothetical protein
MHSPDAGVVVALAGRRIDVDGARESRFPLRNVGRVEEELNKLFLKLHARALVSSAACGADLLALEAAGVVGLGRRVILPFALKRFRETSVVDRPGPWGALIDKVIAEVKAHGDLVVLPGKQDDDESYTAANASLVEEAKRLADAYGGSSVRCVAAVVWEGTPRPGNDLTAQFNGLARDVAGPYTKLPLYNQGFEPSSRARLCGCAAGESNRRIQSY